jgi:hypothetical protein
MKKIGMIIPYFGKWPEWIDLFFYSASQNKFVDFIFYTDCVIPDNKFENIKFNAVTFSDYVKFVNEKLHLDFSPSNPYKLCDLRPFYGKIHETEIKKYDFYGWCDIDIILGNLSEYLTLELLNKIDLFTTHNLRLSGHFCFFRNNKKNIEMYSKIYNWKNELKKDHYVGLDEYGLTNAYLETFLHKFLDKLKLTNWRDHFKFLKKMKARNYHMRECFTTPFSPIPWLGDHSINSNHPNVWYYENGKISNNRNKSHSFIYLHLMNFKSSQWRHDGTKAPWENENDFYKVDFKKFLINKSIQIDSNGISNLK